MYTNKMHYIIKLLFVGIMIFAVCFSLTGCSDDKEDDINKKVSEEIKFLDSKIIGMLNSLNNISMNNYTVQTETVPSTSSSSSNNSSQQSSSGDGSSNGNSDGGNSTEQSSGNNQTSNSYKMTQNSILTDSKDVNWNNMKTEIENLYDYWSPIVLDLYKLNVPNSDILNFSSDLNTTIGYIKAEDKANSLTSLAKLYSYLPKYADSYSNDEKFKNTLHTKSNVLNAYSVIEQDKWDEVNTNLAKAEEYYMKMVDSINEMPNQYNINKGYILIKEFQNSIGSNDKDLLYIKYKNTIQELNII